jgi:hypothetical protein
MRLRKRRTAERGRGKMVCWRGYAASRLLLPTYGTAHRWPAVRSVGGVMYPRSAHSVKAEEGLYEPHLFNVAPRRVDCSLLTTRAM